MGDDRMQFTDLASYQRIWRWMGECGDTHQQAGEVIFSTPNMHWPGQVARPGEWIVRTPTGFVAEPARPECICPDDPTDLEGPRCPVHEVEQFKADLSAHMDAAKVREAALAEALKTKVWLRERLDEAEQTARTYAHQARQAEAALADKGELLEAARQRLRSLRRAISYLVPDCSVYFSVHHPDPDRLPEWAESILRADNEAAVRLPDPTEAALAEAIQQRDEAYAHDEAVTSTTGGALRIAVEKLNAAEAALAESRGEVERLTETLSEVVAVTGWPEDCAAERYNIARDALVRIKEWADSHPRHAYVIHISDIAKAALEAPHEST